jgi:hypothetical protein
MRMRADSSVQPGESGVPGWRLGRAAKRILIRKSLDFSAVDNNPVPASVSVGLAAVRRDRHSILQLNETYFRVQQVRLD